MLKNEFFDNFTPEEIRQYADNGIHIWQLEDIFMRGITTFISIKQVELEDDVLTMHFSYRKDGDLMEELLMYRN